MTFRVVTYNVLASAYIKPEWYPHTPGALLRPEHRLPALVEHVAALDADIICLQEVEERTFAALNRRLEASGYVGNYIKKTTPKPDGCATFARAAPVEWIRAVPLRYADGTDLRPPSGHIAQLVVLKVADRVLGVANTHLRWDSPETLRDDQVSYRQVRQLLDERAALAPECDGWIVCGDMNTTADGHAIQTLLAAGFQFAHAGQPGAASCNANRRARLIDFLFYDAALRAEPLPLPAVRDDTPLPGAHEPSDHVAVAALFEWR